MTVDYTDFDEVAHTDKLHFFYDAQSRPAQVNFNGVLYTYIHNLQGDIVGILDSTGALVVEYKYDAWGRLLSTTGNLADTLGKRNPFRYRGYVYDEETGLYYLRSRYYNPEIGRFINADRLIYSDLLAPNAFAYCVNCPVCRIDESGESAVAVSIGAGWTLSGIAKSIGVAILKSLGTAVAAIVVAAGAKQITKSTSVSKADAQTNVAPAPAPSPTIKPSASSAPKTTPNPHVNRQLPDYPGDDPKVAPEGYEWRGRGPQGSSQGNYHNPNTGESLHPDLDHEPPIGPHWDYWGPDGVKVRLYP